MPPLIDLYGWSDSLRDEFAPQAALGYAPGRVIVQHRGLYVVVTDDGELRARLSGRLAVEAPEGGYPAVGDWVALAVRPEEGAATLHAVMPRRTAFVRKAVDTVQGVQVLAANIDVVFVVASMNADLKGRRLERYLAAAFESGARPVVVLTKADLAGEPEVALAVALGVSAGAPVVAVSAMTGAGMEDLKANLKPGETCVLVGSSGVGKSTLVNVLAGEDRMSTGAIRQDDARGRHTTSHRELVLLPGGALILDTPGLRELALLDEGEGVSAAFDDVEALVGACRFGDCGHTNEPGCAVRAALEVGELDPARWRNFQKLRRELSHLERREDRAARDAERKRWITLSKAQRATRKIKRRE